MWKSMHQVPNAAPSFGAPLQEFYTPNVSTIHTISGNNSEYDVGEDGGREWCYAARENTFYGPINNFLRHE